MAKKRYNWQYILLFGMLWGYCYIIFPSWYLPISQLGRFFVFTFFLVYFSFNGWLLYRWVGDIDEPLISLCSGKVKNIIKQHFPLVLILVLAVILHLYPMSLPIMTHGDYHYHAAVAIPILQRLSFFCSNYLHIPFSLIFRAVVVSLIVVFFLRIKKKNLPETIGNKERFPLKSRWFMIGIFFIGLSISYLYFYFLSSSSFIMGLGPSKHLFRYPPLGKTFCFFFYSLFGVNEFTSRFVQVLFTILGTIYLYRLVSLFRNKKTAYISSSIFLFIPAVFYFGNTALLTCGVLFFVIVANFYFIRYLKENSPRDLILAILFTSVGFLYKRLLVCLPFIFWGYLLFLSKTNKKNFCFYLKMSWLILVPIIPWFVITQKYVYRNYDFVLSHITSLKMLTITFRKIPLAITYPLFILFLISIIYGLWKRRDILTKTSLIWFFMYYALITPSCAGGLIRHSMILYPPLTIMIGQFSGGLLSNVRLKKRYNLALTLFLIYLILACIWIKFPPESKYSAYYRDIKSKYLPYDQALLYIKRNLPIGSRIFAPMGCEPSHFYLMKYHMENEYIYDRELWRKPSQQNINNLYEFCRKRGFDYLIFPRGHWLNGYINEKMVEDLVDGQDPRFKSVKKFISGKNEIRIWKIEPLKG